MQTESTTGGVIRARLSLFAIVVIAGFSILFLYLFYLQVIRGREYRELSRNVASREITIPTQRGEIYDRHVDRPLVMNIEDFVLQLIPGQVTTDKRAYFERLAGVLGMSMKEFNQKVPPKMYNLFQPVEIKSGVSFENISYLAEHMDEFPGIVWSSTLKREYLGTGSLSHVIGYVGGIDESELELMYNLGYDRNSIIGKTGLEKQYDTQLRGKDGKRFRYVDVRERRVGRQAEEIPPVLGDHLVLTVDRDIQTLCEKSLGRRSGAAVVLKPATGEVLALVSMPAFDSNRILEKDYYDNLRLDPDNPLYNRAISPFPPASTFKAIMATATLQTNAFPPDKKIFCSGVIYIGDRAFHCWRKGGHGWLDLKGGVANSCNNYWQTVGVKYLGVENIVTYAKEYGLGEPTGIDLQGEKSGFVPSPEWKEDNERMPWLGGDTANLSIGQGYVTATPLQMANVVSMIVNNGTVYKPHLLKEIMDPKANGKVISSTEPVILRRSTIISPETFALVREAMREVVLSGTAHYVMTTPLVQVAGKTGTSELGPDKKDKTHEWFVGFAPYDAASSADQVVVVVFVENVPKNEWWAPRIANYIIHGIFGHKTFEEAEAQLGKLDWNEPRSGASSETRSEASSETEKPD
ncbi:MAG: penicillin-binding protein 2 [Spirochaetales bacterium]|nr:penicillin-binding protein 2 [Spirochaetales bacterium]